MKVDVHKRIVRGEGKRSRTWIEPGVYEVVREFDKDRWVIRLGTEKPRTITLIRKIDCVAT